jgi:hypothetical protein
MIFLCNDGNKKLRKFIILRKETVVVFIFVSLASNMAIVDLW